VSSRESLQFVNNAVTLVQVVFDIVRWFC